MTPGIHPMTRVECDGVRWYTDTESLARALYSVGYRADLAAIVLHGPEHASELDAYAELCARVQRATPPKDEVKTETLTFLPEGASYVWATYGLVSLVWGRELEA